MIDVDKLKAGLQYPELKQYYTGDFDRDLLDYLEDPLTKSVYAENLESIRQEIICSFPTEDEFSNVIDILQDTLQGMKKADMIDKIKLVIILLEAKQGQFCNSLEYVNSVFKDWSK